ncbi:hypothetical protein JYT90_01135, partial [bacterium AH-315-P07]|nr:hypothetical protein [bacterium AH-315-P07]
MNTRPSPLRLYLSGTVIIILLAAITYLSSKFEYGSPMLERPIVFFVALLVVAGALYVFAVSTIAAITPSNKILFGVLFIGLIMRGALFFSTPILEDDYYRYLWDGTLTANGYNPYAYTPDDINYYTGDRKIPSELSTLAHNSGTIAYRINHGDLGTVYPPVAQASFAVAHVLNPWGLNAWKLVLLVCDVATLLLLLGVLRKTGLPQNRILIYWWNPLLIKEIYNSAHMDPVIMVFI